MRSGIPGFSGAKLAEVRLARGITSRKALADVLKRAPGPGDPLGRGRDRTRGSRPRRPRACAFSS